MTFLTFLSCFFVCVVLFHYFLEEEGALARRLVVNWGYKGNDLRERVVFDLVHAKMQKE